MLTQFQMFWPTGARVAGTKSGKPTGISVSEAVIQTTDAPSGTRTVTSRPGMKNCREEILRTHNCREEILRIHRLIHQGMIKKRILLLRRLLNQPFGEVAYDQGTQAWSPDLRTGNWDNINFIVDCSYDCCYHLLIIVTILTLTATLIVI